MDTFSIFLFAVMTTPSCFLTIRPQPVFPQAIWSGYYNMNGKLLE